jgi:hypothetical protein
MSRVERKRERGIGAAGLLIYLCLRATTSEDVRIDGDVVIAVNDVFRDMHLPQTVFVHAQQPKNRVVPRALLFHQHCE